MALVTKPIVQNIFIALKKNFQDGLSTADTEFTRIATVVPSNAASNVYAWLGMFPQMRELVGSRIIESVKEDGYSIKNKTFTNTVGIPRTAIEDDTYGIYGPVAKEQGLAAGLLPGQQIWELVKDAENHICYDGQNFFDTDHPVAEKVDGTGTITTVSNILSPNVTETAGPAWYLMVTKRAIKPFLWQDRIKAEIENKYDAGTSDHVFMEDEFLFGTRARGGAGVGYWQMCIKSTAPLTPANFEKACKMIAKFKGDGGRPLGLKADLLVVPTDLDGDADDIVNADKLENGKHNRNYHKADLLVTSWLE